MKGRPTALVPESVYIGQGCVMVTMTVMMDLMRTPHSASNGVYVIIVVPTIIYAVLCVQQSSIVTMCCH